MATVKMPDSNLLKDNSNKAKTEDKKVIPINKKTPAVKSGGASMRAKPLAMKFAEVFFEGSLKDAIDYMINDVAIPQIKNALLKGLEVIFYGGANGPSSANRGRNDNVPYNSYYIGRDGSRRPAGNSNPGRRNESTAELNKLKKSFDPRLIVVEDRGEAQRVLLDLKKDCDEFGQVGVDRLFELVDITSDWTSTKYGWMKGDLDDAKVRPCGNGWWFDLPDPYLID